MMDWLLGGKESYLDLALYSIHEYLWGSDLTFLGFSFPEVL